jgi:peptide/nickel transport system permease protein
MKFKLGVNPISLAILIAIIIYSFIISIFAPYDPSTWGKVPRDQSPSLKYPFGTTSLGQDLFWLCAHSLKNSIIMAFLVSSIGILIAMLIGVIAGYIRGRPSSAMAMVIDTFCALPSLPILVLIFSIIREYLSPLTIALWISIFSWSWPAKTIRSIILSLRERGFTYIARFSGYTIFDLIRYHYLPYVYGLIVTSFLGIMLWAIGIETTLAVFGLIPLTTPTLGLTIFWAMNYQAIARGIWWWIFFPSMLLILFIASAYFISLDLYRRIYLRF